MTWTVRETSVEDGTAMPLRWAPLAGRPAQGPIYSLAAALNSKKYSSIRGANPCSAELAPYTSGW